MKNDEFSQIKDKNISAELLDVFEQRFDVETIVQMIDQMKLSESISQKIRKSFGGLRSRVTQNNQVLRLTQKELRDLFLDVELLKRAVTSLGQIGVMERRRIEKELILELFPPIHPRPGVGVKVHKPTALKLAKVDCASRMPICKAACCRIFSVYLTQQEVKSGRYDWNPRQPYELVKNRYGCIYMQPDGCTCTRYTDSRPVVCANFSCANNGKIWLDYEKRILNPKLKKLLEKLDIDTSLLQTPADRSGSGRREEEIAYGLRAGSPSESSEFPAEETVPEQLDPTVNGLESALSSMSDKDERFPDNLDKSMEYVEPPDFSELREIMPPEPTKNFIPPGPSESETRLIEAPDNPKEKGDQA